MPHAHVSHALSSLEQHAEWKEWVRLSDNAKYLPAFRTIGGDPVSPTQNAGITYFLLNGWLIVPAICTRVLPELTSAWTGNGVVSLLSASTPPIRK